ncbi:MAG: hypothetical protein ACREHD_24475 [Pirellulales bacterium]
MARAFRCYRRIRAAEVCSADIALTTAELAVKAGVTPAAIRQRKCRAKSLLENELKRRGVEELLSACHARTVLPDRDDGDVEWRKGEL